MGQGGTYTLEEGEDVQPRSILEGCAGVRDTLLANGQLHFDQVTGPNTLMIAWKFLVYQSPNLRNESARFQNNHKIWSPPPYRSPAPYRQRYLERVRPIDPL